MPRKPATLALCLTEETRTRLGALARSRTALAHHVERSAIILHLVAQHDVSEIAAKLHIDRQRASGSLDACAGSWRWDRSRRSMISRARGGSRTSPKQRAPG
jgi:hypothetical protein